MYMYIYVYVYFFFSLYHCFIRFIYLYLFLLAPKMNSDEFETLEFKINFKDEAGVLCPRCYILLTNVVL